MIALHAFFPPIFPSMPRNALDQRAPNRRFKFSVWTFNLLMVLICGFIGCLISCDASVARVSTPNPTLHLVSVWCCMQLVRVTSAPGLRLKSCQWPFWHMLGYLIRLCKFGWYFLCQLCLLLSAFSADKVSPSSSPCCVSTAAAPPNRFVSVQPKPNATAVTSPYFPLPPKYARHFS